MDKNIEDIIENIEFPHPLFSLCLKISEGKKSTKRFVSKNQKYGMAVMCIPEQYRMAVVIEKPGEFGPEIEENIDLYFNDFHCEYSIVRKHKSLVARSVSDLVNRHKNKENPPYQDWIKWILDGAHDVLKDSTRINAYTGEPLPYFEETDHDRYLCAMIGTIDKTGEWLRKALEKSNGKIEEYVIFPPDPEEVKKKA